MKGYKKHVHTPGTIISSVVFVGMGLWLLSEAMIEEESQSRQIGLTICAIASMLGAARYRIGALWAKWQAQRDARYAQKIREDRNEN